MKKYPYLFLILCLFLFASCSPSMSNNSGQKLRTWDRYELLIPSIVKEGDMMVRGNISLHYYYYKKPGDILVVFFHGGPGSDSSFFRASIGQEFARLVKGSVLYIDQPGSGLSQKKNIDPKTYNFRDEIARLHQVMEKFSPGKKLIIFGESFGGTMAAHYFQAFPQDVHALILSVPWLDEALCREGRKFTSRHQQEILKKELALSQLYKDKVQDRTTQLNISLTWMNNEPLMTTSYLPLLNSIKVPTLVLAGEEDYKVPKNQIKAMEAYLKQATFVYISDAAHGPYVSQKTKYLQAIEKFLMNLQ